MSSVFVSPLQYSDPDFCLIMHDSFNNQAGPSFTAGATGGGGVRRSTSSSSSGRRSSTSAFSLGTGSVRGPGSWTRSSAGDRSSTSTASSKVSAAGIGEGSLDEGAKSSVTVAVAAVASAATDEVDVASAEMGGISTVPKGGVQARAILSPAQENDEEDEEGREEASSLVGVAPMKLPDDIGGGGDHENINTGAAAAVSGPVDCAEDHGEVTTAESNPGREASFGTVSSAMFMSGTDDAR